MKEDNFCVFLRTIARQFFIQNLLLIGFMFSLNLHRISSLGCTARVPRTCPPNRPAIITATNKLRSTSGDLGLADLGMLLELLLPLVLISGLGVSPKIFRNVYIFTLSEDFKIKVNLGD